MTTQEFIKSVADLVQIRDTISHGEVHELYSRKRALQIAKAEGISTESVGVSNIGDDMLADKLHNLDESDIALLDIIALNELFEQYKGPYLKTYLLKNSPDQLEALQSLIDAAEALIYADKK